MEENSENASPFAGGSTNGDAGANNNTVRGVPGFGSLQQQQQPVNGVGAGAGAGAGSTSGPTAQQQLQQQNGTSGGTLGGKSAFATKRNRIAGGALPPPVYSPLGPASSASSGSGTSSYPSSNSTTPSASPSSANAPLPTPISNAPNYTMQQQQPQQSLASSSSQGQISQPGAAGTTNAHLYPALHLHPLNDTFIPKQISLYPPGPHNRIKIGRQTNAKTVPAPNNGYFDSKVLSRQHAEVWCEGGKVYIKDVKSSNGTFINGERLSPEAVESDVFELHSSDMVEFGIDITSEDTKTIVHHKVAARCFLVMNADDAIATSRNFANYYRDLGDSPMHRRPGMGGAKSMGGSGMNLDQVLNRLQTELQKSRETGAELGTLTSTIGEIHETLGGNLPGPPLPAYRVPPFVPPNPNVPLPSQQVAAAAAQQAQTQQLLQTLQTQLQETQDALHGHVERIKNLEELLREQERMKAELKEVRDRMDEARAEWDRLKESREEAAHLQPSTAGQRGTRQASQLDDEDDGFDEDDDKDEEHTLETADSEDEDMKTIRLDGGLDDLTTEAPHQTHTLRSEKPSPRETGPASAAPVPASQISEAAAQVLTDTQTRLQAENSALSSRMEVLSTELSVASQLSVSLKNQYAQAAETIRGLEEKVTTLERALHPSENQPTASGNEGSGKVRSSGDGPDIHGEAGAVSKAAVNGPLPTGKEEILKEMESLFIDWKKNFEDSVKKEREGWEEERERLRVAVQEWERKSSLFSQQASSVRRKRRSKASTVESDSPDEDEYSDDVETGSDEAEGSGGFASPITDDSGPLHGSTANIKGNRALPHNASRQGGEEEEHSEPSASLLKRPRSRRRRRASDSRHTKDSAPAITSSSRAGTTGSRNRRHNESALTSATEGDEDGGSELRRRISWIPFSKNFDAETPPATRRKHSEVQRAPASRKDSTVTGHPAFPIVSAAGVIVIGYLAYTAILQHQK